MNWPMTLTSALFLIAAMAPLAGTFDGTGGAVASSATPVRLLNCTLAKTSFKGDNEGWISSAEKSIESTCLAGDTPIKFSAGADSWQKLLDLAGQPVMVKLAENKGRLKDAKTDWIMVDITAQNKAKTKFTKLCGDDKAPKEFKEIWSHGYRVGQAVDVWQGNTREKDENWEGPQKGHKNDWYLDVRMSAARNWQWAPDGSVRLGSACADQYEAIAASVDPLVFVYDQGDDDPRYAVIEIYRMD
ncbi:MAG TPA: hypothetical protein DDY14_05220 [Chromatiaceae bacterium]|jgi:hypothetical protein|nr:MAG: hypothetical protein N838_19895 [Thiohalocapsa sp. PB-PSB1]QQO53327.1 MAG: hypothetical protein N838_08055 [Thiohalocapsa sp. PB-PSB1]HBG94724.1 hypothetical protein [Chromatiaceae bacterium]HCS92404.1 hypothetical protein [Chromatiaceae bacterium]